MIGNEFDDNGVLLYPDGEPRFKVIFTNGGSPEMHGESLGEQGRERIRTFYYRGGSYTGACGGAYLTTVDEAMYYKIWPGSMPQDTVHYTTVGGVIPDSSPLLKYNDFGNDHYIDSIVQHYGAYASVLPPKTEVLLIHDKPNTSVHNKPSCWAYKENDTTGRIVVTSPHPENEARGQRLDLMKAILLYAVDGVAPPSTKGSLTNGVQRVMNKSTGDNDPINTNIGDRQYHHFTINLPDGSKKLKLMLVGNDTFNLNLYLCKDTFAFASCADYADTTAGANKSIFLDTVLPGAWHASVECATTVIAEKTNYDYKYSGQLSVLNGVAYTIKAEWAGTGINAINSMHKRPAIRLAANTGSNSISIYVNHAKPYTLKIFDMRGKLCWEPCAVNPAHQYTWQPKSDGMYILCLQSGIKSISQLFTVVR